MDDGKDTDTPFKAHRAPSWTTMTQETTEWMIKRP